MMAASKKPVDSIYGQIKAHPTLFIVLTLSIVIIGAYSVYLINGFTPDVAKSIAEALVVYDGVILGFSSLLLMEEFRYLNEALKSINEVRGKPEYETYKNALSLAREYFYLTLAVIIALAFSGLFGLIAISSIRNFLYISLVLVYFGTWFIVYYTARMVIGRDWLIKDMTKG